MVENIPEGYKKTEDGDHFKSSVNINWSIILIYIYNIGIINSKYDY
ncbi:hypothetical protein J1C67_02470 [Clostridium gasigenes]|nr:hypothetical protein [Clostridium gasigenes]NKF06200.1 hypothetical protein [Clostridium gasigenes]QSW20087.1 hypothetical protein J1C67_02470 [Clostridium gasigenes]